MPRPHHIVNSEESFHEFCARVWDLWNKEKYITFEWRIGADRSLTQNGLFHVWLTEYAAHLLKISKKEVTEEIREGMKLKAKQMFYQETGESWMVHNIIDPWNPDRTRTEYTSSASWGRGEMYNFLCWLQMKGANDGVILESKGEFERNKMSEIA